MGNYMEGFYHFVWATKRREAYITPAVEVMLHDYIRHHCRTLGVTVHAVNGMTEHLHLACSLPATLSISEFVGKIKGASAWFINQKAKENQDFRMCLYWQANYGALTFAKHDLPRIVQYIDGQKQHHERGRLSDERGRLSDRMGRCDDDGTPSSAPEGLPSAQTGPSAPGPIPNGVHRV